MSIHWTLIAGFLYAEIGTILLLLVPFISTKMWNKVFKSRFLRGLESQLIYYFYVLVAILILFFLDAIREMQKYSAEETQQKTVGMSHLDTQMQMHMRLFRAQRNFYIAGFALFLCLVIKRLVGLISANAGLQAEKDAAMKQAESASRAAEMFMKDGGTGDSAGSGDVAEMKAELEKAKKEADAAKKDMNSMKSQSESLAKEYDRLMEEKDRLQRKVNVMGEDKKDD
jgi:B-cell receptor-associated protein 31